MGLFQIIMIIFVNNVILVALLVMEAPNMIVNPVQAQDFIMLQLRNV